MSVNALIFDYQSLCILLPGERIAMSAPSFILPEASTEIATYAFSTGGYVCCMALQAAQEQVLRGKINWVEGFRSCGPLSWWGDGGDGIGRREDWWSVVHKQKMNKKSPLLPCLFVINLQRNGGYFWCTGVKQELYTHLYISLFMT